MIWTGQNAGASGAPSGYTPYVMPGFSKQTTIADFIRAFRNLHNCNLWHRCLHADLLDGYHATSLMPTVNDGDDIPDVNFDDDTPAAPTGDLNVKWQKSGANVSAYVDTSALAALPRWVKNEITESATVAYGQLVYLSGGSSGQQVTLPAMADADDEMKEVLIVNQSGNSWSIVTADGVNVAGVATETIYDGDSLLLASVDVLDGWFPG